MYIETKSLPDSLRSALARMGFARPMVSVEARETYTQAAPCSGQGSRGYTAAVNLATGETQATVGSWGGSNAFNPSNVVDNDTQERPMREGFAIIHGSNGNHSYAAVYVHAANLAPLLPEASDLTDRQKLLLDVYAGLNSQGRKNYFERNRSQVPTDAELNALAVAGMITRNKAGAIAITAKGRNNRGGKSVY